MTKAADNDGKEKAAAAYGGQSLYPFLMQSAAAFAAATAVGIGIQAQFARAMLGMFEANAGNGKATDAPAAQAPSPVAPVVTPEVATPKTVKAPAARSLPAARAQTQHAPATTGKPAAARAKAASDDLKRISGIGPKLEQVLNAEGVRRLAEIAAWSQDDMQRFDAEFGLGGRIGRDDWIGQAKAMAAPVKKGK